MNPSFGELNIQAYKPHHPEGVVLTRLFEHEEMSALMVVLPPHTEVSLHSHENSHELFDVVNGQGVFQVDGVDFPGPVGKCVFVKAGTPHAMRNDSDQPWTVRITYQERIYPRHIGKLVNRAIRKRLRLE